MSNRHYFEQALELDRDTQSSYLDQSLTHLLYISLIPGFQGSAPQEGIDTWVAWKLSDCMIDSIGRIQQSWERSVWKSTKLVFFWPLLQAACKVTVIDLWKDVFACPAYCKVSFIKYSKHCLIQRTWPNAWPAELRFFFGLYVAYPYSDCATYCSCEIKIIHFIIWEGECGTMPSCKDGAGHGGRGIFPSCF